LSFRELRVLFVLMVFAVPVLEVVIAPDPGPEPSVVNPVAPMELSWKPIMEGMRRDSGILVSAAPVTVDLGEESS